MPEFAPSEAKTALAPITVSPSGLACEAELFLGPDDETKVITSGRIPFTSMGVSQDVRLPVTMPDAEGTYHVYLDVYCNSLLVAAYQAVEDVTIAAAEYIDSINLSPSQVAGGGSFTISGKVYLLKTPVNDFSYYLSFSYSATAERFGTTFDTGAQNHQDIGVISDGLHDFSVTLPSYLWVGEPGVSEKIKFNPGTHTIYCNLSLVEYRTSALMGRYFYAITPIWRNFDTGVKITIT